MLSGRHVKSTWPCIPGPTGYLMLTSPMPLAGDKKATGMAQVVLPMKMSSGFRVSHGLCQCLS